MEMVPPSEVANRIVALQGLMAQQGMDAAIIRQNADLFYFSGTVQDGHLVIPVAGQPLYLVRRDVQRAGAQSPLRPIVPLQSMRELPGAVQQACGGSMPGNLGMELDVLPASTFFFYDEKIFPRQRIVDVSGLVRQVRMIKSDWEIAMMRGAAAISRAVADAVPKLLREGVSELELSAELEAVARKAGHLGILRLRGFNMDMYFGHILAGPDAALSSYADAATGGPGMSPAFGQGPSTRPIRRNSLVSVDTMLNHNGYLNDQTRNFAIGRPPRKLEEAYKLARDIHSEACARAIPGTITGELYDWVLRRVAASGWMEYFMGPEATRVKFIGHGLGIEVDEFPFIAQGQTLALERGMTFAFEPKFILPGLGVAGMENTYWVTARGLESLNTASEELVII
jgi:Xaa-Pro aminopeptidase